MIDGKKEEALKVFQLNAKRFPNKWPVHVGLMRAYAATGDKKALEEGKLALAQAPDEAGAGIRRGCHRLAGRDLSDEVA